MILNKAHSHLIWQQGGHMISFGEGRVNMIKNGYPSCVSVPKTEENGSAMAEFRKNGILLKIGQ